MSLFNIFKSKGNDSTAKVEQSIPWIIMNRIEQLDEIAAISKQLPVAIFKYSTTCGVSRTVLRSFERDYPIEEGSIKLYFLDLHAYREISNEVAHRFQVVHQSPQILVIKNGVVIHHASHQMIDANDLTSLIS